MSQDYPFHLKASFTSVQEKNAFFEAARKNDIEALRKIIDKSPEAVTEWTDALKYAVIAATYRSLNDETLAYLISRG